MMLAESVNEINEGPFANIQFSDKEMYELKIAAWLHDCGKVATPEYVVDRSLRWGYGGPEDGIRPKIWPEDRIPYFLPEDRISTYILFKITLYPYKMD